MNKKAIILFFPAGYPEGYDPGYPWFFLYLERMIRHLDVELILVDERLNKDYTDIIRKTGERLLFAGVSAILGYQIVGGVKFSETVKSITDAPVIWGGWFPTIFPEMILKDGYADYICYGQGELPFKSFSEKMLLGDDVSDIPGIGYLKDGKTIINPNDILCNPESFPRINKTLIDINLIIDSKGKVEPKNRILTYLATHGCMNNCSFCCVSLIFKNKWFAKKISEIIDDMKYFIEKGNVSHVVFWDDNFFSSKKFVLEFCNEKIKAGLTFTWAAHAHVSYFLRNFSDEDIKLIYKAGCKRIVIGAESGDQEALDLINKKIKVEDNLRMLKVCKKHNIRTRFHTMICFPFNPNKDFYKTLNLVGKAILIDRKVEVSIRFYKPIPKTPLYQLCLDKGFVHPSSTKELIASFFNEIEAPWYKMDYHKVLDYFVNFYLLFANPFYFTTFPLKKRPFMFVLNVIMFPIIYIRFKFNWMKFPLEAKLFRVFSSSGNKSTFLDTASVNKTRFQNKSKSGLKLNI